MITIQVVRDFSRHPAGRFEKDGPYSGEHFRRKFLVPNLRKGETITIEMDGARGYGSSFLEEAFGGLIRDGIPLSVAAENIRIVASNPTIEPEVQSYMAAAWDDYMAKKRESEHSGKHLHH